MLSRKEKEEILQDSRDIKRREEFSKGGILEIKKGRSLDDFIYFLDDIQKVLCPFAISREKTLAGDNKL